MEFGRNIRIARQDRGLSQDAAAKMVREIYGVRLSSAYLSMIERGDRTNFTTNLESALRDFFRIHAPAGNSPEEDSSPAGKIEKDSKSGRTLPVIGAVKPGLSLLSKDNISRHVQVPSAIKADFVLEINDDSMIGAGVLNNDLVLCRDYQKGKSEHIVVVVHDDLSILSQPVLRYYIKVDRHTHVFKAAHPAYPQWSMDDGYRIAGVMVALLRQEIPTYDLYKKSITATGPDEWAEVVERASDYGITPRHLLTNLDMQWKMIHRIKKK